MKILPRFLGVKKLRNGRLEIWPVNIIQDLTQPTPTPTVAAVKKRVVLATISIKSSNYWKAKQKKMKTPWQGRPSKLVEWSGSMFLRQDSRRNEQQMRYRSTMNTVFFWGGGSVGIMYRHPSSASRQIMADYQTPLLHDL